MPYCSLRKTVFLGVFFLRACPVGEGGEGYSLCIFDPFVSRVIKAIEIPYPVTVVEGVTGSGGAQASPHVLRFVYRICFLHKTSTEAELLSTWPLIFVGLI